MIVSRGWRRHDRNRHSSQDHCDCNDKAACQKRSRATDAECWAIMQDGVQRGGATDSKNGEIKTSKLTMLNLFRSIMFQVIFYHIVPVSFLVDTGAGVSLLKGTVWDRKKPQNHNLKTVTVHRLVRVDGMPISVRGSTVVQFSVYGIKFQHA